MITSGLVVTLSSNAALATQAAAAIAGRVEFTVGERSDRWLPVAMEARDDAQSRELHDWIGSLQGVEYVDVTSVHFHEEEAKSPFVKSEHPRMQEGIHEDSGVAVASFDLDGPEWVPSDSKRPFMNEPVRESSESAGWFFARPESALND